MANIAMLQAKGLFTFQNFLSAIPEGSLLDATNVNIDRDGIIEPRRGITEFKDFGTEDDRAKQLLTYKNRILVHYGSSLAFDDGIATTFVDFDGSYTEPGVDRIKGQEMNSNFYFTTDEGIKKIASATDALSAGIITDAGGIKALDVTAIVNYSTAGFFPPLSQVAYKVVWGTRDVNENLILGTPSSSFTVTNYTTDQSGTVDLTITVPGEVTTDYFYQVYRTATTTADTFERIAILDPGDEMKQVYEAAATTADIAAGTIIINDITPDDFQAGGTFLYTNENTGDGILQANDRPPVAQDIAIFRNSMFYANTKTKDQLELDLLGVSGIGFGEIMTATNPNTNTVEITNGTGTPFVASPHGLKEGDTVVVIIPNSRINIPLNLVNIGTNTFTSAMHGLSNDQIISFEGANPVAVPLATDTDYYIINATTDTFQLAATKDGPAIDITSVPIGTSTILFAVYNPYVISSVTANTFRITTAPTLLVLLNTNGARWFSSYITTSDGSTDNNYYFVGGAQNTRIVYPTQAALVSSQYFEISSAENVTRYAVWFDKTGTDPQPTGPATADVDVFIRVPANVPVAALRLVQGLTYTAVTTGEAGNNISITYTTGGTAGAEVVTVEDTAITVQIQVGVSTAAQIKAKVDAYTAAAALVTVAVTVAGAQGAQAEIFLEGGLEGVITAPEVKLLTEETIAASTFDFIFTTDTYLLDPNAHIIVNASNGRAFTSAGSGYTNTLKVGYGQDASKNFVRVGEFFVEGVVPNLSTGQVVDDTARSLVRVINLNQDDVVYAYYLSQEDDVPGAMFFEAREINTPFTVVADTNTTLGSLTGSMFNPDITTEATSSNEEKINRLYFSKYQQPEAVPALNFVDIGPRDKAILRIIPLRESLFVFKEDGIYRLTGEIAPNFSVTLFDNSVQLIASDSASIVNNLIYCLTDGGIATISETGVGIISRPIENVFTHVTTANFPNFATASFGIGHEEDRAYFIYTVTNQTDTFATQCLRYNTFTQCWTRWDKPQTCVVNNFEDSKLYFGSSDSNFVEIERKELTRRDFADREFDLDIPDGSVTGETTFIVSPITEVEEGDALIQTQYVTHNTFNALLAKLDYDPRLPPVTGLGDTDYLATLEMIAGDNLSTKMTELKNKLNLDPGIFTNTFAFSGTTDFATIQTEYNVIIGLLNIDAYLKFDNYQTSTGTIDQEMTIDSFNRNLSTVTGDFLPLFMSGPITLFKGIRTSIVWAPMAFGDPSLLKHIRENTILFETSDFRGAEASYATDLSPSFAPVEFIMDGSGVWGSFTWGDINWGGGGSSVPFRTYIPRQKQRCRYMKAKFVHNDAFYKFSILGISYTFEINSERAYRGNTNG